MKKNLSKILNGIEILTGATIICAILMWAPVCTGMLQLANGNMVHMKCYYTGQAALLLSIVLIVAGIESFITNSRMPLIFITIGILLLSVTFTSPLGIGVCVKVMSCHTTAFWIRGGGIIAILCGIISLFIVKPRINN